MKVLLAFDSFKDTLSALEVSDVVTKVLKERTSAQVVIKPLSDGGEGFLCSLQSSLDLETVSVDVVGPLGDTMPSKYSVYYDRDSKTRVAIIEMAAAAGLEFVPVEKRNPLNTTAVGVAQLISHSITQSKCNKILLGLGGSATSEGGITMLSEMGGKVFLKHNNDRKQADKVLFGKDLLNFHSFELPDGKLYPNVSFDIAVDVNNPFTGENGAVRVFAKQKGASLEIQDDLEHAMVFLHQFILENLQIDLNKVEGSGGTGGIGGMLFATLQSVELKSGAQIVAEAIQLEKSIQETDIVLTGEGSFDAQTASGKVISKVQKLCQVYKKPLLVICGRCGLAESDVEVLKTDQVSVFDMSSRYGQEKSLSEPASCLEVLLNEIIDTNPLLFGQTK